MDIYNGNSTVIVESPLRIDFCGGFTDVTEFNKLSGGTSIANMAIDVFHDIERTKKVNFNISVSSTKKSVVQESKYEKLHKAIIDCYNPPDGLFQSLQLNIDFPISTGLGTSGALSVIVVSSIFIYKNNTLPTDLDQIFKEALLFESMYLKVKGGVQDFISAIAGGYSFISIPKCNYGEMSIHNVKVNREFEKYVEENVILLYSRRKIASHDILEEISVGSKIDRRIATMLKEVKTINESFNEEFLEGNTSSLKMLQLSELINKSSVIRDILTNSASNINLNLLKSVLLPLCFSIHSAGAGGGCIILYGKPENKETIVSKLGFLLESNDIVCFYPKVNNRGLTFKNHSI